MTRVLDRATDLPAEEAAGGCWTQDYAFRHCEGYMVDGPDGHLGFVSEVVDTGGSLELVVGGASEEFRIGFDAVQSFDPSGERIVVALPGS